MLPIHRLFAALPLLPWCLGLGWGVLLAGSARGATITIVNSDGPNEGLNDPTLVAPVGGNPGTTVGAQRLFVMQHAAHIWGAKVDSPVEILVEANFDPLDCSPSSGTLGAAAAFTFFRDFHGAPRAGTYYPVALANSMAGTDLDPGDPDMVAFFNSAIGTGGCLSSYHWYYGVDGNAPPGTLDFFDTVLHELAHGLGFVTLVDLQTGAKPNGFDDAFMLHLEDHSTGLQYPAMSNAQRLAASQNTGNLHWTGSQVVGQSGILQSGRSSEGHVEMWAPSPAQLGSSVSHFSTSLFPNELMEPFANTSSDRRLTEALLADLGWTVQGDLPSIVLDQWVLAQETCLQPNGAPDPGEAVTIDLFLRNTGTGLTDNLVATLLPTGSITPLSAPETYGILPAFGQSVARPFTLLAQGACGEVTHAQFQLQDGAVDLGILDVPLRLGSASLEARDQSSTTPISIPGSGKSGPASPYPSGVQITGVTSPVQRVSVTLHGLSHEFPDNLDVLLVGPTGQAVMLLSDVGGGTDVQGITLILDDTAPAALPDGSPLVSGTYRPTNIGGNDAFPSPAPAGSYAATLAAFQGLDPNGTWQLFIMDDSNPNSGVLQGGWTLTLHTELAPECCAASPPVADLAVSFNPLPTPLNAGVATLVTGTVTNAGPGPALLARLSGAVSGDATLDSIDFAAGGCQILGGQLECDLGALEPGAVVTLTFHLTMGTTGTVELHAQAGSFSEDPVPGNNEATAFTQVNSPPTIMGPVTLHLREDMPSGPIAFVVADLETPLEDLVVTARSSNTNLVPPANLTLSGTGGDRTLHLVPAPDLSGTAGIVLTVSDGHAQGNALLVVTFESVEDPPRLEALPDASAFPGQVFQVTAKATDPDSSAFQFTLITSPPGALIGLATGLITWTPPIDQIGTTNLFVVEVADDSTPMLTDTESFHVVVQSSDVPVIQSLSVSTGVVTLVWSSLPDATYRVQYREHLDDPAWTDLPGDVVATGDTAMKTDLGTASSRFYQVLLLSVPPQ